MLDLRNNRVSAAGVESINQMLQRVEVGKDLRLHGNVTLTTIILGGNPVLGRGVKEDESSVAEETVAGVEESSIDDDESLLARREARVEEAREAEEARARKAAAKTARQNAARSALAMLHDVLSVEGRQKRADEAQAQHVAVQVQLFLPFLTPFERGLSHLLKAEKVSSLRHAAEAEEARLRAESDWWTNRASMHSKEQEQRKEEDISRLWNRRSDDRRLWKK